MQRHFGYDFKDVRIHSDERADRSARAVDAFAYTVGRHVAFRSNHYAPRTREGRRLLVHELTHVVQQGAVEPNVSPSPAVRPLPGKGHRIAVAPSIRNEPASLEAQANAEASATKTSGEVSSHGRADASIARARVPLPRSIPLCGRTLTHIDIEPPRSRPLEPCLPPSVMVTRINIVGRDLSVPTPGKGPQVFNLHVGYYTDPATGRYCAIADDSKTCIAPRCLFLGCFPTLREVLDAIVRFLKAVFVVIGIIALAILIALIIELLGPILVPAAALAEAGPGTGAAEPGEPAAEDQTAVA